jgi:hypothetical protein
MSERLFDAASNGDNELVMKLLAMGGWLDSTPLGV